MAQCKIYGNSVFMSEDFGDFAEDRWIYGFAEDQEDQSYGVDDTDDHLNLEFSLHRSMHR
jgi:hypothetical protein